MQPSPFTLTPLLYPKVWGGTRLAGLGKPTPANLPPAHGIGESWEVADLDATSAGGAGGTAAHSVIASGPLAGHSLRDAVRTLGPALLGPAHRPTAAFPLLVKYLDARQHLSVQVHPSAAYAAAHPGAYLKTESWYVLAAEPAPDGSPAVIYSGLRPGVTTADLQREATRDDGSGLVALMNAVPAVPGACYTLPSGTVHALGAGVLVAEVQTPSDTTFRLYDWSREYGRTGRERHTDAALACAIIGPAPDARMASPAQPEVARTHAYAIREQRGHCEARPVAAAPDVCVIVMMLQTFGAELVGPPGTESVRLATGQTAIVPAAIAGATELRLGPRSLALLIDVL